MITFAEYQNRMALIGLPNVSIAQYYQYTFCEVKWLDYLQNIFIPNLNQNRQDLRLIIMESCPGPNNTFPNQNYIFNNLNNFMHGIRDSYLWQTYRGVLMPNPAIPGSITKHDALVQLAQQNVLLVDIIPTHQIDLNVNNLRQAVIANLINIADASKINSLISYLNSLALNPYLIKSVTSLGSTYNPHLNIINNMLKKSNYFGSMTDPTSHYPSYNLLINIINNGF